MLHGQLYFKMRHGKKINHLGRKAAHRNAMLSNMACSLIAHKRIKTTVAKAKALRGFVEPLLTKSKTDSTHSRRVIFSYLQDKIAVAELFREVAPKIASRPGGYTRILKLGARPGDSAEMCFIELVDYNELMLSETAEKKTTRRSRRGGKKKSDDVAAESGTAKTAEKKSEAGTAPAKEKKAEEKKAQPEAKSEKAADKAEKKEESKAEKKDEKKPDDDK